MSYAPWQAFLNQVQHHTMITTPFLVRAKSKSTGFEYLADTEDSFTPVRSGAGQLHVSRLRFAVRRFPDAEQANRFVQDYSTRFPARFDAIVVERASPEFVATIPTMETDRQEILGRLEAAVPLLMETFDFGRVAKVMAALDWKYAGHPASPTVDQLRQTAKDLLHAVIQDDTEAEISTGGFRAWAFGDKLYLQFVAATAYATNGKAERL